MNITINGQKKELTGDCRLTEVIQQFTKKSCKIIAEVNGSIIKAPHWPETVIKNGDQIELITLVGGG